jgi:hypothetical protein
MHLDAFTLFGVNLFQISDLITKGGKLFLSERCGHSLSG